MQDSKLMNRMKTSKQEKYTRYKYKRKGVFVSDLSMIGRRSSSWGLETMDRGGEERNERDWDRNERFQEGI